MGIVYVVQQQEGKNILPAEKYGELQQLISSRQNVHLDVDEVSYSMHKKLHAFNDSDYLLLLGDPLAIGMAFGIAAKQNQGRVKVLKWDRQEGQYYIVSATV